MVQIKDSQMQVILTKIVNIVKLVAKLHLPEKSLLRKNHIQKILVWTVIMEKKGPAKKEKRQHLCRTKCTAKALKEQKM
jgi:hypothetical protein